MDLLGGVRLRPTRILFCTHVDSVFVMDLFSVQKVRTRNSPRRGCEPTRHAESTKCAAANQHKCDCRKGMGINSTPKRDAAGSVAAKQV